MKLHETYCTYMSRVDLHGCFHVVFFVEGFDLKNGKSKSVEVDHTVDEKKFPKQPPEMVKNG